MRAFTVSERLRYWFDNTMSRGTVALIGWLVVLTLLMVGAVVALVLSAGIAPINEDGSPVGPAALVWDSFMQALSPEQVTSDTGGWPYLLAMLALMLGGLLVASTLIGVLTSGIEQKLDALRRGRSIVAETDHIVILGWSSKTPAVVRELVLSNASQRRSCVAVLAPKDRAEMEEAIRDAVGPSGRTRVVCRTGDPIVLGDLDIVNPHRARAVIIPSPESGDDEEHEDPDAKALKMIFALTKHPRRTDTDRFHIVAELNDAAWRPVAAMVGEEETELVFIHEVIARIIAQAARQTGLSVVVRELLTFEGNEFYFAPADSLAGRTYGEALFAFDDAEPVGIRTAEGVTLNPPPDQRIGATDDLVVLAEDDVHITRTDDDGDLSAAARGVDDAMLVAPVPPVAEPEHLLILGWSPRAPLIICTLNAYLEPGSTITVVTVREDAEAELAVQCAGLTNLTVAFQPGDPTDRALLNRLGIEGFDHVVVMSRSHAAPQAADTHALVTLLHLRDLAEQHGSAFNIVSEMNDVRNQALAEVTRADDFVVSDRLISLMVAQIAEKRQLADVFTELFSPVGAELYLRPASDYVVTGRPIPFYAVVEAARRRNETALGFRRGSDAYERNGLHLNPRGSAPVTFTADDRVILLANS